jgi:dipeptidase E
MLSLPRGHLQAYRLDPDPGSRHMGERREIRRLQFLEENGVPVVGLREAAMLHIEKESATLLGTAPPRLCRRG